VILHGRFKRAADARSGRVRRPDDFAIAVATRGGADPVSCCIAWVELRPSMIGWLVVRLDGR
jgi:hypothetical protein